MSERTNHSIIIGDSRRMDAVADSSVQLIITSPPYWQLKDYGSENQIGYNDSYEDYINNLNLVWNEAHRVLENGCRLCVNIGDQFARSAYYGRYKVIPIRTEIIRFCETIGFDYMGAIIWQKVTNTNTTGGASVMGSFPYPRNGLISIDYEFILLFKKTGEPGVVDKERRDRSSLTKEEWRTYFAGHWNFAGARQDGHIAAFPAELPTRLIKMFSYIGDTVLDPFAGSGTTALCASRLERNSISYEINPDHLTIIREKLDINQDGLFDSDNYVISYQPAQKDSFQDEIEKLPYRFKDPVQMERQADPKENTYGSVIDGAETRETFYSVKRVISPSDVQLSSGQTIRLAGVVPNRETETEAVAFLLTKTKGRRVYIQPETNDRFYLFLKNRTNVNAHLIRSGFVSVDEETDYRFKSRFIKYGKNANGKGVAAQ
ncbi:MAG: site-specific DNA-methyltransferase [Planctomycetota bacterium]